jgi:hypothetical protein
MSKIKDWFPIISVGVIFVSFLNLSFYFSQFGIAIQHYIDVSEIVFSLTTFVSSAYTIAFLLLFILITSRSKETTTESTSVAKGLNSYKTSKYYLVRQFSNLITERTLYILVSVACIAGVLFHFNDYNTDEELIESSTWFVFDCLFMMMLFSCIVMVVSVKDLAAIEMTGRTAYVFLITVTILMVTFLSYRNKRSADLIRSGHPKYSFVFKTRDTNLYKSSDSLIYIGGTKDYFFLYQSNKESTIILQKQDIIEATIQKLRGGL